VHQPSLGAIAESEGCLAEAQWREGGPILKSG